MNKKDKTYIFSIMIGYDHSLILRLKNLFMSLVFISIRLFNKFSENKSGSFINSF